MRTVLYVGRGSRRFESSGSLAISSDSSWSVFGGVSMPRFYLRLYAVSRCRLTWSRMLQAAQRETLTS